MVEIERSKMTSNNSALVKIERRDDQEEIDQLAAKMVEANKAKMANLATATASAGQVVPGVNNLIPGGVAPQRLMPGTLLGYFSRNSAGVGAKEALETINKERNNINSSEASEDLESAKGRFGWTDSPVPIPYIFRKDDKKFCSTRILEQRVSKLYANVVKPELSGCICIQSYYISDTETRLLNEINVKHCDWQFGRELFNVRDLIVSLEDAQELLQFLKTCQDKLVRKSCDSRDRCGFFRIGGESVVPYTVVDGVKYVPLFYFEGETGNLDKKAIQITGWDLAYLKLCCKVQGIRNELFSNNSYSAVSVDEIKQQFPPQTELQLYWPSRSLLDVPSNISASGTVCSLDMWIKKPSGTPPPLPVSSIPTPAMTPTSSVIQKNPSAVNALPRQMPSSTNSSTIQSPAISSASRTQPAAPTANSSGVYNGWNRVSPYANMQQSRETANSSHNPSSVVAAAANSLASVLQSQQQAAARAQAAAAAAMLMPSMQVQHPHALGHPFSMMQYAQAVLSMSQQQQQHHHQPLQQQQHVSRNQPVPPPPPPPQAGAPQAHACSVNAPSLDSLLRANGINSELLRPPQRSPSNTVINRSNYSTSQSPLTGVVPGSSPHSRNSTGASPRPGLPVPSSSLAHASIASSSSSSATSSSTTPKPPPPPLIPVNGSMPFYATLPNNKTTTPAHSSVNQLADLAHSASSRSYHSAAAQMQQQQRSTSSQVQNPTLLQQQHSPQAAPPFKLQLYQIENQMVPCVNSRQYVYNNLMIALPDMAAYMFPQIGHQTCKQILQDGVGVTLYDANPQQMQVLKSAGKVSVVGSLGVDKVPLVNVRDVVQYMPQIRFIMTRLDSSSEMSHSHPSKRQRVS